MKIEAYAKLNENKLIELKKNKDISIETVIRLDSEIENTSYLLSPTELITYSAGLMQYDQPEFCIFHGPSMYEHYDASEIERSSIAIWGYAESLAIKIRDKTLPENFGKRGTFSVIDGRPYVIKLVTVTDRIESELEFNQTTMPLAVLLNDGSPVFSKYIITPLSVKSNQCLN